MKKNASDNIPSFQFYPNDWLNDTNLRLCSDATKGAWIDMICLMYRTEKIGFLGQKVDKKWSNLSPKEVAKLTGMGQKKVKKYIKELLERDVLKIDESGLYYSKRIVEDHILRKKRRDAGKLGGNPKLVNQYDNQELNPLLGKSSKQNLTPSSSPSFSSSKKKKYILDFICIINKYPQEFKVRSDEDKIWFETKILNDHKYEKLDIEEVLEGWDTWLEAEHRKKETGKGNKFPKADFKSSLRNRLKILLNNQPTNHQPTKMTPEQENAIALQKQMVDLEYKPK